MNRVKIKYAPAIKDMTVDKGNDDEGMEAVLCPKNGRRQQQHQPKQI